MTNAPRDLLHTGPTDDGQYFVQVRLRIRIPDDVALRAAHLIDPKNLPVEADLGTGHAVVQEVAQTIRNGWSNEHIKLELVEAHAEGSVATA